MWLWDSTYSSLCSVLCLFTSLIHACFLLLHVKLCQHELFSQLLSLGGNVPSLFHLNVVAAYVGRWCVQSMPIFSLSHIWVTPLFKTHQKKFQEKNYSLYTRKYGNAIPNSVCCGFQFFVNCEFYAGCSVVSLAKEIFVSMCLTL